MNTNQCDIGLIGLGVMGENLVLNMESKGFSVAVFNRTTEVTEKFIADRAKGKNIQATRTLEEFVGALKKPHIAMMMVKAGSPVDSVIGQVAPLLEKGDVIIENGPQVSAVIDRVEGVKQVLANYPGIKILSDDQDGKGSRDGGLAVAQGYLTRFPKIDAIFTINDPEAIGTALAAQQAGRKEFFISSVDGSPDIEAALKDAKFGQIESSSSQDFHLLPKLAVKLGVDLINGIKPDKMLTLVPSSLVTRENVEQYKGWNAPD